MMSDNGGPDYRDARLEQYEKLITELQAKLESKVHELIHTHARIEDLTAQLEEEREEASYSRAALRMAND